MPTAQPWAQLGYSDKQEVGRWVNNRAENAHLPVPRRERAMQRFRQMKTLQKFASVQSQFHNHFSQKRRLIVRQTFKALRSTALAELRSAMV